MKAWRLSYRALGRGRHETLEQIYASEGDFLGALKTAYRNFGTALSATLPDGTTLTEAALRDRFPPE
jgi:hypothetical protein